ncbi:LOW QUALITY PROTEIN: hypothetical protein HID58_064658 [Brassica napus]|uniref:Uncharacterized protein n=1 Tax=Brassica napus TaxID=3708 RepID=A0ABQ7ZAL4_BRANA|nr:LOW QUALITY PROTEIN: hypothetical protein HID58_064658 [Brassica napus]
MRTGPNLHIRSVLAHLRNELELPPQKLPSRHHQPPRASSLNSNKNSLFCGPLTSFDWNEAEPRRIGTSSTDTTCTIWDIDLKFSDIAWVGVGVFVSVSADGSVRVIRSIRRLSTGALSLTLLWCALVGTSRIRGIWLPLSWTVLDIRFPALPVVELQRHQASVNALGESGLDPILAYTVGAEIEWSSSQPYWVAIAFSTKMQILRSAYSCYHPHDDVKLAMTVLPFVLMNLLDYAKLALTLIDVLFGDKNVCGEMRTSQMMRKCDNIMENHT